MKQLKGMNMALEKQFSMGHRSLAEAERLCQVEIAKVTKLANAKVKDGDALVSAVQGQLQATQQQVSTILEENEELSRLVQQTQEQLRQERKRNKEILSDKTQLEDTLQKLQRSHHDAVSSKVSSVAATAVPQPRQQQDRTTGSVRGVGTMGGRSASRSSSNAAASSSSPMRGARRIPLSAHGTLKLKPSANVLAAVAEGEGGDAAGGAGRRYEWADPSSPERSASDRQAEVYDHNPQNQQQQHHQQQQHVAGGSHDLSYQDTDDFAGLMPDLSPRR